ncbi:uncharacterized protein LOC114531030 isoform X2 [Dendronephthya gigantea]|nr:uncharacterized protein LOC114531030 isoform X2 [Dendronephthya gigantea]
MKTVARQGLLLVLFLLATSHSLKIPDFMEDELFDPSDIKYNTDKAGDGDDEMPDDTSASAEEDAEMMETVDSSNHDEDDGMDDEGKDKKTVSKSKIQHNSSKSKAESKENDKMEDEEDGNEDKEEDVPEDKGEAVEEKKDGKEDDEENKNDEGKESSNEVPLTKKEDDSSKQVAKAAVMEESKEKIEETDKDEIENQTNDSPKAKKTPSSDEEKDTNPSETGIEKDDDSKTSEGTNGKGKANANGEIDQNAVQEESKSNDNNKKEEKDIKTADDKADEGTRNEPIKTTNENTVGEDSKTPPPASPTTPTNNHSDDKIEPVKSSDDKIGENEKVEPTLAGENSAKVETGQLKRTEEDSTGKGNTKQDDSDNNDDNKNNNNKNNDNENKSENKNKKDSDSNDTNKDKFQTDQKDEKIDTDKPEIQTDYKTLKDGTNDDKTTEELDNDTKELQSPKTETSTESKVANTPETTKSDSESDQLENNDDKNDKTQNKDELQQATNDKTDNKDTLGEAEKPIAKHQNNEDSNQLQQTASNDNDKNGNSKEKQNTESSKTSEKDLDSNKPSIEKSPSYPSPKNDNGTPDNVKESDFSSDIEKAKSKQESGAVGFDDSESNLKKDNDEQNKETSPKSDNLGKDVQKIQDENQKEDEPASKSDKDIQQKVEQLIINTGDESQEEAGKLVQTASKDEGTVKSPGKVTSTDDNDAETKESSDVSEKSEGNNEKTNEDKERTTEKVQDDNSEDKADVVNTLVESVSGNGNARGASANEIKDQNNAAYNIQQALENQRQKPSAEGKKSNLQGLLNDLVPSGVLPNLPEGFTKLSEMSTVSFTYNVHENNDVTVTSDIKEPMRLFDGKLEISSGNLEFSYNDKEHGGQKWQFKAQGTWVNGEQVIDVVLESSKHEDHFTLTGRGDSLALHDYSSIFAEQKTFIKSDMNMHIFEEIMLSNIELYVVFKDFDNIVSLVSGDVRIESGGQASRCQAFIEKFPRKKPVFSILLDFVEGSPHSVLTSLMADTIADIPYVKDLLNNKGLFKVANGGFGFAASSGDVKKLRLNVFGEGMLERELGSHISSGVTLTLPVEFHTQNSIVNHDTIIKISPDTIGYFPTKGSVLDLNTIFKTLSEFTRPKITGLGYPDVGNVLLRELRYDLSKSVYTVLGYASSQFNIAPGMLYLDNANLEFRQQVPDEFATLTLYGTGSTKVGQSKFDLSIRTNIAANELLIEGHTHTLWSPDISTAFGVAVEIGDDARRILDDNRMLNMNIENTRVFATVKDGRSGLVHFSGSTQPVSWNDAINVEVVVFHDNQENKRRITIGYLFNKLPLTYAIDAFSFGQFPTPRLLDNSRNISLVLSPVNTESLFVNPSFNGLSFMRGLSLIGQFRLPDVCSLNILCESAAQLLGTEKWYQVQGLVSSRGYTLSGYVDKDFNLAKDLKLTDNILQFNLGNYSYMSISTNMRLEKNNLTFSGYVNFDPNGVRLRMSSDDVWRHPFPGEFLTFDRLQVDVPLLSGVAIDEILVTGLLNFGLSGSLYRIYAPAYLTFTPSNPKDVGFQATMTNITVETITSALNFKSSLPGVLIKSRFPSSIVARYTPKKKKDKNIDLYGKLDILSRTVVCKLRIDEKKQITATTSHSKFPLILDDGLITVYADQHRTRLGPRAWFKITPENTKFKLDGFTSFMGLGAQTEIDVSESGTEFTLNGNLFGVTKTVVSFMSPDSLPENGPYLASACLPDIIPQVTSHVGLLLASAADQAERYMKQATTNYDQATAYHEQALADEHKQIMMLDEGENDIESDDREMFFAEEKYNKTCREQQCGKTCIGCTSWLKCCDHDVFGNCVKCPGWKPCCWRGMSPICKAKNHACRIMKKVAAENLQTIARRVYAEKEKKRAREKILWKSEFMKGKTQAVLDAARRALHLVNHDSRVGLGAAASIKRFGLERLVNIRSICFHTTLKTLATSCVTMRINTSFANKDEMQSIPYYGCLNRELVPKLANHIAHFMFHDKKKDEGPSKERVTNKPRPGHRRSGQLFGKPLEDDEQVDLTTLSPVNTFMRRRRDYDLEEEDEENRPFWLIRNNYQTHAPSLLQQRTTVPRTPLKKKWQIPATRKGKCKVYRQLVEICKDMMSTVKKMSASYDDGKDQYYKRLAELQLGINTTIYDLEKQVMDTPELRDRLADIEMNIRTVGAGVSQWRMNCEADQEDQNKIAIQEWVSTMEGRIRKLGGQGVDRFLSNLFRAFEGMFLGADTPKHSAQKVLSTLQAIREISATFHDIFGNNEITLEKAKSRAEIVMTKLKQIKDAQIFCDD